MFEMFMRYLNVKEAIGLGFGIRGWFGLGIKRGMCVYVDSICK